MAAGKKNGRLATRINSSRDRQLAPAHLHLDVISGRRVSLSTTAPSGSAVHSHVVAVVADIWLAAPVLELETRLPSPLIMHQSTDQVSAVM